jgi:selenocysteine lyase/cysteine desulfurase
MANLDDLLEQEFPVEDNFLYLNHAAVSPWPVRTGDAVRQFAAQCVDMGARDYAAWIEAEQALRVNLARLVHAPSADDIALLKNTSEALSFVAQGFPWQAGDNVVIGDEEFPSNRIVWESLATRGVAVRYVALGATDEPEAALLSACDNRTRVLSVSSVQYASGLRMNLTYLGQGCRERGVAFCVDAIQGLGVIGHDVERMHIDFLMADAHKWLLGPEGIAVFYCAPAWRERLVLQEYGWHMTEDLYNFDRREWRPAASARRFECGSANMLGIHALNASLSLLDEVGEKERERRILANADRLIAGIRARPHLELLTRATPGRYAGIVTFRPTQVATDALYRHLVAHNVVCAQRGGGVRFSPHVYNRPQTLQRALELTDDIYNINQ